MSNPVTFFSHIWFLLLKLLCIFLISKNSWHKFCSFRYATLHQYIIDSMKCVVNEMVRVIFYYDERHHVLEISLILVLRVMYFLMFYFMLCIMLAYNCAIVVLIVFDIVYFVSIWKQHWLVCLCVHVKLDNQLILNDLKIIEGSLISSGQFKCNVSHVELFLKSLEIVFIDE